MTKLDPIEQEIIVDIHRALDALEALIAEAKMTQEEMQSLAGTLAMLQTEIDALHGKQIDIDVRMPGGLSNFVAALTDASGAEERVFAVSREGTAVMQTLDEAVTAVGGGYERQVFAMGDAATAAERVLAVMREVATANVEAARGGDNLNASVLRSGMWATIAARGWGAWNAQITLWGGLMPGALGHVRGFHIALDAAMEAIIAFGAAIATAAVTLAAMAPAAKDIYNHLTAVHDVATALNQQIAPMNNWFEKLQHTLAPNVVEAYGGAIRALNSHLGGTSSIIQGVAILFDDWVAKIGKWMQQQGGFNALLKAGSGFLSQFGTIVGEVAKAIYNLVLADPGTAHYLLDLIQVFARFLDIITSLPTPILMAALALHSLWLWGGLLANVAVSLLGPLRSLMLAMGGVAAESTAMAGLEKDASGLPVLKAAILDIGSGFAAVGKNIAAWAIGVQVAMSGAEGVVGKAAAGMRAAFAGLLTNPLTWVVAAAAGLAFLAYQMSQTSNAANKFSTSVDNAMSGTAGQFFQQLPDLVTSGIQGMNQALQQGDRAFVPFEVAIHKTGRALVEADFPALFENAGKAAVDFFTGMVHAQVAQNSVNSFADSLNKLSQGTRNYVGEAAYLIGHNHTAAQSFALLSLAGVQAKDSFSLAIEKVTNLVTGYQNLGVRAGILTSAVNAVTLATEIQASKIGAVTQAYSQFIQLVTGGESAFVSFAQQMTGTLQAAGDASATLSINNGKVSVSTRGLSASAGAAKVSIDGLSTASLQLRSAFTQSVVDGTNLINSLLSLSSAGALGAKGTAMITQAGRDMGAMLLPLAKNSTNARTELYALAQLAGYSGPNDFGQLAKWIGNVKDPMQNLDKIQQQMAVDAANLSQDTKNLAEAIGQNLTQAMAAAVFQAAGGQQAFNNFANAVLNAHGNTQQLTDAAGKLVTGLLEQTHNAGAAQQSFFAFAKMLGISQKAAQHLWDEVISGSQKAAAAVATNAASITSSINSIPSGKTITIAQQMVTIPGTAPPSIPPGIRAPGAAAGMRVPGYGGGDRFPALLEGGEAVVPKHLVPAIAPFLGAHGVPGFAHGGVMRPPHHTAPTPMELVIQQWAREIWSQDLRKYGRHSPIALKEVQALFGATKPGKGGAWMNPQYRLLEYFERMDMMKYYLRDVEYWKLAAKLASPGKGVPFVKHLEQERMIQEMMKLLYGEMGYSRGGRIPFGHYDRGGYLPQGMSLALNTTGRPEPVGGAGGPVHIHIEVGGREVANAMIPDLIGAANRYSYRNSGKATGILKPT